MSDSASEQIRCGSLSPQVAVIAMARPGTRGTEPRLVACGLATVLDPAAHDGVMGVPETVRTGIMGRNAKVSAQVAGGGR